MNAITKYEQRVRAVNSLVCVGLDSDCDKLPEQFKSLEFPQFEFNKWIISQTYTYASAYKPNIAFYEARGIQGLYELQLTIAYLQQEHPDIFTICDAKRGDIESTNVGYVRMIFDDMGFDAVTLHPYLGKAALMPFLERRDKASIILCKTSNSSSGEFQDLIISKSTGKTLWEVVAKNVSNEWNKNNNCMLVVGATYPEEIRKVREIVGEMTLLIPGVGAQGGETEAVVKAAVNSKGLGMIVSASRSIIFAHNPSQAAADLRHSINMHR